MTLSVSLPPKPLERKHTPTHTNLGARTHTHTYPACSAEESPSRRMQQACINAQIASTVFPGRNQCLLSFVLTHHTSPLLIPFTFCCPVGLAKKDVSMFLFVLLRDCVVYANAEILHRDQGGWVTLGDPVSWPSNISSSHYLTTSRIIQLFNLSSQGFVMFASEMTGVNGILFAALTALKNDIYISSILHSTVQVSSLQPTQLSLTQRPNCVSVLTRLCTSGPEVWSA